MLFRRSYLLPPPTSVAATVGKELRAASRMGQESMKNRMTAMADATRVQCIVANFGDKELSIKNFKASLSVAIPEIA